MITPEACTPVIINTYIHTYTHVFYLESYTINSISTISNEIQSTPPQPPPPRDPERHKEYIFLSSVFGVL